MSKKKKKNRNNPNQKKVQDMIRETLFPEVHSMWLDDKITLLSALMLCLNVKLDFALNKFVPSEENGGEEVDKDKPEDSDLKTDNTDGE